MFTFTSIEGRWVRHLGVQTGTNIRPKTTESGGNNAKESVLPHMSANRPSWTKYFIGLAKEASKRSHDIHTQHGCVITDREHRILGVGYNGFPAGLKADYSLPTTRPAKYDWMMHAERNALANCSLQPKNGVAYVTGQCCNQCVMALWQHGVRKVVMCDSHGSVLLNAETQAIFDEFVQQSGMTAEYFDPYSQRAVISGYFDPIHPGHLAMLRDARKWCEYLIVIVNNDLQARNKKGVVFLPQDVRKEILGSMSGVDEVVIAHDVDNTVSATIASLHHAKPINTFLNGGDVERCREHDLCLSLGIVVVYGVGGNNKQYASSRFLDKFVKEYNSHHA